MGIGTNAPTTRLTVAGDVLSSNADILGTITARNITVSNNSVIEFGFGVSGKEANAGKIGYGAFTTGLDIVGAGTTGTNRVVRVFDILTTTTVNATNINEGGTTLTAKYTLSNQLNTYSNFVNTQYAPSNQLGNYTLGSTFSTYSNFVNTQYARSNQLSNYAFSNGMSNWNFASNTSVWSSNQLINYASSLSFNDTSNFAYTDRYWTMSNSRVHTGSNVYANALTVSNLLLASGVPNAGLQGIKHNASVNAGIGFNSSGMVYVDVSNGQGCVIENGSNQTLFSVYDIAGIYANRDTFIRSNLSINTTRYLEFGEGLTKETNAGRIAYQRLGDLNNLDIVGAGGTSGLRRVKLWDILSVDSGIIEGRNGVGMVVDTWGFGLGMVGIGHSNLIGSNNTYALRQGSNGETHINVS